VHAEIAKRLYTVLLDGSLGPFASTLDEGSVWELPGRSALAGVHRGPAAILGLVERLATLKPIRPDAYDIAASEYHAVLMTRLVGDGLDSDHAFVVVATGERLRLDRAFHYVFDQYAFDAYFQSG
jgi:hypothetical protein